MELVKKLRCPICERQYLTNSSLNRHLREKHKTEGNSARKIRIQCPDCEAKFFRREVFCKHVQSFHGVDIELDLKSFPTYEDFEQWKKCTEKELKCTFLRTSAVSSATKNIYFSCDRSGLFKSTSTGKRKLKSAGSKKINATCPSAMVVKVTDSEVQVKFWKTHFGHTCEILDVSLKTKKRYLQKSLSWTPFSCPESLSEDLSTLLDESSPYDLELKSENHTIKAHKNVLCFRSQVFSTMLHSDMTEDSYAVVEIQDIDSIELVYFVKYLYTGILPDLTMDTAMHLYEVGDKYMVKDLMEQCACVLIENLTNENSCTMLALAYTHNDHDFKETVISFILEKKIPLLGDPWQTLCDQYPKLAIEVLNRFVSSNISEECKANM